MTYTVKRGDSLSKIASDHGITLAELLDANPQYKANPDNIQVGETLSIPGNPPQSHTPSSSAAQGDTLGKLSEKYETGGRGPGTVSAGVGDPGGVSYGSYQMTSKPNGGTVAQCVSQPDFRWRDAFSDLTPATPEFSNKWKEIAAAHPEEFQEAQHLYIKATHFDVLVAKIKTDDGLDVTKRSHALQDVIWSTAVQHGPNTNVVHRALETLRGAGPFNLEHPEFDNKLIPAIYAERGRQDAQENLVYFSKASPAVQQGVASRFVAELKDALKMLENELHHG